MKASQRPARKISPNRSMLDVRRRVLDATIHAEPEEGIGVELEPVPQGDDSVAAVELPAWIEEQSTRRRKPAFDRWQ